MKTAGYLETVEALEFARLDRTDWNNHLQRGLLPDAPKAIPGQPREFDVDDLTAAWVLGWLLERQVLPSLACLIATGVLRQLRKTPSVKNLSAWKCRRSDGVTPYYVVAATAPKPTAVELFPFDVADIKARAVASIRAKLTQPE